MTIEYAIENIETVAQDIINANPAPIILFNGEMGAGKTTFIKALCTKLGVQGSTSSPTFSLVNEYKTSSQELIYHFDLYRLKHSNEALDMGIDEYLYSGKRCFIEWSDKISHLIPENHSIININILNNGKRMLELK